MERPTVEADRKDTYDEVIINDADLEQQPEIEDVSTPSVRDEDVCDDDVSGSRESNDPDAVKRAIRSLERAVRRYRMLLSRTLQLETWSSAEANRGGNGNGKSRAPPDRVIRHNGGGGSPTITRDDKVREQH